MAIFVKEILNHPIETEKLPISNVPIITGSMETISQRFYPIGTKQNLCRDLCHLHVCKIPGSLPVWFLRKFYLYVTLATNQTPGACIYYKLT